ncbi:MAG TPA: ATP-binding protein [Candidatus Sabulitectum sp.]|nr:ATP-binding protein [Candidatus Sabulitectum sp.]HPR22785.1 ATP-binding protein [Candidatus Sabulitectum sp.]
MKELVIISGKGGTGKTSITGCFAALAKDAVIADCDVDAADLHMLVSPEVRKTSDFISGNIALIREKDCTGCGVCAEKCRFEAISASSSGRFVVDPHGCEGCGVCVEVCPVGAVDFPERHCGQWYMSETRFGPMVHARLGIAQENSGKLVSLVRREAAEKARELGKDLVIVDGPPGVGCPVIASITGASLVVIVTEPTLSGKHDMIRVIELAEHFSIPAAVIVNKWDINPEMTAGIEEEAEGRGVEPLGRIPYDRAFTASQIRGRTLVEESDGPSARNIETIWEKVWRKLK